MKRTWMGFLPAFRRPAPPAPARAAYLHAFGALVSQAHEAALTDRREPETLAGLRARLERTRAQVAAVRALDPPADLFALHVGFVSEWMDDAGFLARRIEALEAGDTERAAAVQALADYRHAEHERTLLAELRKIGPMGLSPSCTFMERRGIGEVTPR